MTNQTSLSNENKALMHTDTNNKTSSKDTMTFQGDNSQELNLIFKKKQN